MNIISVGLYILLCCSLLQGLYGQEICPESCQDSMFQNSSCLMQKQAGLCDTPAVAAKFCPCTCQLCDYPNSDNSTDAERKKANTDYEDTFVEVVLTPTVQVPVEAPQETLVPVRVVSEESYSNKCGGNSKPNFLIIMTDDQGHDDMSFYNWNNILYTPNMDQLAQQSVQFENFYTDSLCAPTRASLLTGRHHLRTGVWGVHGALDYINLDETIIAEVLKQAGYSTAHFGKWHSGTTSGYNAWDRGFDTSYTTKLYTYFNNVVKKNRWEMATQGWVEDWLADRIVEYLQERSRDGQPFYILWTPMSIHKGRKYDSEWYEDFIAPEEYYDRYAGKVSRDLNHVFAALEYFDAVLGKVMRNLDRLGLGEDTIVMFFGDNGPLLYNTDHANGYGRDQRVPSKMKEQKGFIEENGIRNFLFVRGTGRYPAGQKVYENVGVIDIYPTMLELAGTPLPKFNKPLDGVSFAPLLCKNGYWKHSDRTLYFHEALKNTLGTDQIPALNNQRLTDKSQKLLQFYGGGLQGKGFQYTSGLRWKQWKYIKTDVFDMNAQNHLEYHWNKLYFTDHQKSSEMSDKLKKRLVSWWDSILSDVGSFQKPTFLIGRDQVSSVLAIGAIERTPYSVFVGDRAVSGFKKTGDFLACKIQIERSGWYNVNLVFGWNYYRGATMKVAVGKNWQINNGEEVPTVTRKIDSDGPLRFGKIYLEKSEGKNDEMILQLIGRNSNDGSEVFWWIDAVEFVRIQ